MCPVGPPQAAPRDSHHLHLLLLPLFHLHQRHLPERILLYGNLLNLGGKSIVPPTPPVTLVRRQKPQKHLLTVIHKNPQEATHQLDIVSQTNTSTSTERKKAKARNSLTHQTGGREQLQIPVRTVTPLRKTGLTNQTKAQREGTTPGHGKAGTT